MEQVASVTKLKASLSAYLADVKSGEEVLVTERGKPIARLVPYRPEPGSDESLARLLREGVLRAGSGRSLRDILARTALPTAKRSAVEALLEEREQGF